MKSWAASSRADYDVRSFPVWGCEGLYTSTLFRYDQRVLWRTSAPHSSSAALLSGRSTSATTSQLLLLWKGIATFVARNPRYRMLFGTVSISNDSQSLSQQNVHVLYATRAPPRPGAARDRGTRRRFCGRVVMCTACGHRRTHARRRRCARRGHRVGRQGCPVLLRQYLKLNARLLGFNNRIRRCARRPDDGGPDGRQAGRFSRDTWGSPGALAFLGVSVLSDAAPRICEPMRQYQRVHARRMLAVAPGGARRRIRRPEVRRVSGAQLSGSTALSRPRDQGRGSSGAIRTTTRSSNAAA